MFLAGDCCLRADAEDQTNGFFVAVFERIECNEDATAAATTTTITDQLQRVEKNDGNKRKNHTKRKRRHLPVTRNK